MRQLCKPETKSRVCITVENSPNPSSVISPCFAKKMLSKIRFFSRLKCQLKRKKIDTACFYRFSKFQPTRKWVNKVKLSRFSTQNLFQICACEISARKAKHLDVTTMFTFSHANKPLGQSEHAYYLSYFINCNMFDQIQF